MIYLYVKQHKKTGLKYFGRTIKSDPFKYKGSGKYWKKHINKHGNNIETLEVWGFDNQELCTEFALKFSEDNNIVESEEWANLSEENGEHLWTIGFKLSDKSRENISKRNKGKLRSVEQRENISRSLIGRKLNDLHRQKVVRNLVNNKDKFGEAHHCFGRKNSQETINRMKDAQSGEKHSQYGKRGEFSHNYGTKRNDETKKLMSEKKIGKTRYYHPDCLTYKWFNPGLEPEGWSRNKCQHT